MGVGKDFEAIRNDLIEWFKRNGREYPWRKTTDPFLILISEVFLQRTKAHQVMPVFMKFIEKYPDPHSLSRADLESIEEAVASLGLKKRAVYLKNLGTSIIELFEGEIPKTKEKLLKLPGVGPYTANAVLCFAYGEAVSLIDSNVIRIYGRLFGFVYRGIKPNKKIQKLADSILDLFRPREFNRALIDLGAVVCTARRPSCNLCPIRRHCDFYANNVTMGSSTLV